MPHHARVALRARHAASHNSWLRHWPKPKCWWRHWRRIRRWAIRPISRQAVQRQIARGSGRDSRWTGDTGIIPQQCEQNYSTDNHQTCGTERNLLQLGRELRTDRPRPHFPLSTAVVDMAAAVTVRFSGCDDPAAVTARWRAVEEDELTAAAAAAALLVALPQPGRRRRSPSRLHGCSEDRRPYTGSSRATQRREPNRWPSIWVDRPAGYTASEASHTTASQHHRRHNQHRSRTTNHQFRRCKNVQINF